MPTDPVATTRRAAVAGMAGVAVALAVVELAAGASVRIPSAVDAISQQVIPAVPEPVTRWAIATFGTADITVLLTGTTLLALLVGAAVGIVSRERRMPAALTFVAFGVLGWFAMRARSEASPLLSAIALLAGVVAGLTALSTLLRLAVVGSHSPADPGEPGAPGHVGRRAFLTAAAGVGAAVVVVAATGRLALRGTLAVVDPGTISLPSPARALPAAPRAASLPVPGLTPLFTPNDRFYVIDTAVAIPQVEPSTWSLRIHGLVEREMVLTYDDLLAEPLEEVDITIACVSNEVGGDLIGNARWLGTRLAPLLERAGVRDAAAQVIGRSVDGFTAGFPTGAAFDGRAAMIAVGMNGTPLPTAHGFPARLVVPGLYGYVSATKWLAELELTTWDVDGYWIPRGWAKEAPIKTQSRIDVPRRGATVASGDLVVAGVAWAPTRAISRVEVRIDGGAWHDAELSQPLSDDTWVQWRARVPVDAGDHVVQVRATDGTDRLQPEVPTRPAPDGAEGWHRITFRAT